MDTSRTLRLAAVAIPLLACLALPGRARVWEDPSRSFGTRGAAASQTGSGATAGFAEMSASVSGQQRAAAHRPRRPNIVLLLTDDQAYSDLSVMPRTVRWFRKHGTWFTRAYSTFPLCCPARATILTGQEAHNHGVLSNFPPRGSFTHFHDSETLAVWLNRAGYTTAMLGKYLNEYPQPKHRRYIPPGWDQWYVPVNGIYSNYAFTMNENRKLRRYRREYQTTFVAERASHIIAGAAGRPRPFFLWVSFLAPHNGLPHETDDPAPGDGPTPIVTPAVERRYRDSLGDRHAPRVPSLNERNIKDKGGLLRHLQPLRLASVDEAYRQRLESLRSVDDAMMRILGALRATGELRRTLVVFASDNGMLTGQHRWYHKVLGYEESTHVPLLMAGPRIKAGARRRQLVSLTDLGVTLAEAGHANPRITQDGLSLFPLSRNPAAMRNRSLGFEGTWPKVRAPRAYTAIRTADGLVLLRWYDGHEEVYDLRKDPFQLHGGVSSDEGQWVPRLRRGRKVLSDCVGTECRSVRVTRR